MISYFISVLKFSIEKFENVSENQRRLLPHKYLNKDIAIFQGM